MNPINTLSPSKCYYKTRIKDGVQLWATRNWNTGERAEYCRTVLNREPFAGES